MEPDRWSITKQPRQSTSYDVNQQMYNQLIKELITQIKQLRKQYIGVYGIPRGGTIIAVYVSHALNIPMLTIPTTRSLIVDDIIDSGNTITKLLTQHNITNATIATLHLKNKSAITPDVYVQKVEDNDWVVYPYENQTE